MPKTTEQLAASRAGETAETNGFGGQEKPLRPAGVYQLKNKAGEVVDTQILKTHPKFGDGQASAFERVGYEYVRPAKPGEVKEIEVDAKQLATEDKAGNVTQDDLKGALARINALEKENADLKSGQTAEEKKGASDNDVTAESKEDAKEEAQTQLENRGQADGPLDDVEDDESDDEGSDEDADDDEGDTPPVKTFSQLNLEELKELAETEQITLPAEADTKAKIREVITQARAEKETN